LIKNKDEIIKQIGYDEHSKNVLENLFTFLVNNNIVDELKIVETGDNNIILKEIDMFGVMMESISDLILIQITTPYMKQAR